MALQKNLAAVTRTAVLSICRKRGTEAYFSKQALECLWNKISSSPTPIPKTDMT